jgi:hypothetical protein
MSKLPLGEILTTPQQRDAIHVAVAPVVAGVFLAVGSHVTLREDGKAVNSPDGVSIGIVDPFLRHAVQPGETFWLFLYPGTITTLRHDWTHPSFPESSDTPKGTSGSERWLCNFAAQVDLTYNQLMTAADIWVERRDYLDMGGHLEGQYVPDDFWTHYENVRGVKVQDRGSFFTCSC